MNKAQFLQRLTEKLHQLPPEEIERQRAYYDELISDMMEDGLSEAEAVEKLGDLSAIVDEILRDTPLPTLVKTRIRPKNGWTAAAVVAAIVGIPLWLPLLLALLAVLFAVAVSFLAVIASLFAVVLALGFAGIVVLVKAFTLSMGPSYTLLSLGAALLLMGLGCLGFLAAEYAAKGLFHGGKWLYGQMKSLFIQKEAV